MDENLQPEKYEPPESSVVPSLSDEPDAPYLAKAVSGASGDGSHEKLKWIHLRYHPPGLILQYLNEDTMKEREKMIDLLEFNHFSSLEESARSLMRSESLLAKNKPTLMECLQKLKQRCKPDFRKQFQLARSVKTHIMPILCCCLSRDGSKFATASYDKNCKIWSGTTGAELATFSGHFDAVYNCMFSTSGERALTGSYDGTLRLWPVPKGEEVEKIDIQPLHIFHGAQGEIEAIDYSTDGLLAAAGATDKAARIYELNTGITLFTFEGHTGNVNNVKFNRSCNGFLTGSSDGQLGIWDLRHGKLNEFLRGHESEVMKCSWDFVGNNVISCSVDKLVNVWDLRNTAKPIIILKDNTDEVWDVKFNSRDRLIASGSKDGRLLIYDIKKGITIANKETAHCSPIHQVTFNAAGTHIITSSSEDSVAKIWIADSGENCQSLEGHGEKVIHGSWNYLGDRILTVSSNSTCSIWE